MTDTPGPVLSTGPEQEQRILVAIDFSEDSKAALAWACNFAACSSAPLILLHVVHDLASHPGFYHPEKSNHLEPMQDVAESMMAEFLAQLKTEHPELCSIDEADLRLIPVAISGTRAELDRVADMDKVVDALHIEILDGMFTIARRIAQTQR